MPAEILPTSPNAFGYRVGQNQVGGGLNGPGCLTYFGHSYFDPVSGVTGPNFGSQGGLINSDQSFFKQSLAALGLSESKVINYAVSASNIIMDNTGAPSGSKGGHIQALQSLSPINIRQADGAPYRAPWTNNAGLVILCYGINDIQSFAGGSQDGLYQNNYREAWRTVISRCRAAAVYEALTDTNTTFSGGGLGGGTWSSVAGTTTNSGTGWARSSTIGSTVTLAIPSDYDGGYIGIGFRGVKGLNGGTATITIDGVLTDTIVTSSVTADSVSAIGTAISGGTLVLTRRYQLPANQAHTIVITVTAVDGNFDYNFYQFEAKEGNPIIYCSTNRLRIYAGGFDHDNNVLKWNTILRDLVIQEFSEPIEEANLDAAIQASKSQVGYDNKRISYDTIHLSELGSRYGASAILDAYIRLNETATLAQTTTNQRDTIGSGFYIPQSPTVANQYLYPGTLTAVTSSAMTAGGTVMYCVPVITTRPCTLGTITFDSITVATGTVRIGLMHDKGNVLVASGTVQGPLQRCYDWGSFTQTVNTAKTFAIPAGQQKLPVPGVYWLVLIVQAASTLSCTKLQGGHPYINSSSFGSPRPINGACYTVTYGGAQTTIPVFVTPLSSTLGADVNCPFVALGVLSVP